MPYFRELEDGNGVLVSTTKMMSKSDVEYAAAVLNERHPEFFFEAIRNFMGYEGYDGGVIKNERTTFNHKGRYISSLNRSELLELCKDRPMVHQSKSHE